MQTVGARIKTKIMKEYTVEQWFSLLPPDIREKAISYTSEYRLATKEPTFEDALSGSFLYNESPEGLDFWGEISAKDWGTPQENQNNNDPSAWCAGRSCNGSKVLIHSNNGLLKHGWVTLKQQLNG